MCGIWGVLPKNKIGLTVSEIDLLPQILALTSLRGRHSTGIAVVGEPSKRPKTVKTIGGPEYLLNADAFEKVLEFATKQGTAMFGHGRFATKGAITAKNAHPFVHDHITMVHNGTISYGVSDEMKEVESEVDSHGLCVAIAKKGLVDALDGVFGAYAVIVHDQKEKAIYVVRNSERPLHRIETKDFWLIMSESDALRYLNTRNVLGGKEVEYFPQHTLFRYDLTTFEWTTDSALEEAKAKKWAPYPSHTHTPHGSNAYGSSTVSSNSGRGKYTKVNEPVILTCIGVEKMGKDSITYRYSFLDSEQKQYYGMSSRHEPDRVGQQCYAEDYNITLVKDKTTTKDYLFVRFRELEWFDKTEPTTKTFRFLNGAEMEEDDVDRLLRKEKCALCGGDADKHKLADTILTGDGSIICDVCVKEGKHYGMGFCQ